jgi:hypothetical protein
MVVMVFSGRRGRASWSGLSLRHLLRRIGRHGAAPVSVRPPRRRDDGEYPAPTPRETLALVRGYARLPPSLRRQVANLIQVLDPGGGPGGKTDGKPGA